MLSFALEEEFEIGELTHFNNPVYQPTAVNALLELMMVFGDPAGLDGDFTFSFEIDETPNIPGDGISDDDIILFPNTYSNEVVTIAGVDFTLQLLGFRSDDDEVVTQFVPEKRRPAARCLSAS